MIDFPVPTLLITGFLGSGKTTFINWLLEKFPEKHISVLLNEFGDIKLESQFVKAHHGDIVELANGCMCCVAKSDVPHAINYILDKSPQTEHILVEASGMSDPEPVRATLQSPELSKRIRYDANLCIVDALNFESTRAEYPIVLSQVGDADIVLLSKVSLVSPEQTQKIITLLSGIIPDVKILTFDDTLTPGMFLDPGDIGKRVRDDSNSHQHTHESFVTCLCQTDKKIDKDKILKFLQSNPKGVIRAKGYITASTGEYLLIQYVGNRLEVLEENKKNMNPSSVMLFIGKDINSAEIEHSFQECVVA
ncbi:hypothetical protein A2801_04250 [Candidatus Woesebacteria bacterium RIFCSPHIGHO2_01_FULL_41_10]|uniref:CobW C-terminal domain-containing protein n=1 Tax=Candidatus Woesebacteria bacterium RIFCSPHIGHO2_01_FULL_41_10 TaxID=1802500 RepID=A0A1F7YLZ3_9BACT|nr:MAG: hypothetical protein A2801_04250 [Candidatus Woesebacteria bacterium RIFCSPHIGHO2_01_FULL_41_10]